MYENLAYIYDKLMYDVDYSKLADYIEGIFRENGITPSMILDLGCGTGNFCIEMAKRHYDMIGIDLSADMLSCAKAKTEEENLDILYINQDMAHFELYGTVDAVVCLMDSVNYITDKNAVKSMFKLVKNYLNPGGLFIFDVNTSYKFEKVYADNIFYDIGDDISYIWVNKYDKRRKICEFDLTFFIKQNDFYKKHEEFHVERAYSPEEIKKIIDYSGLSLVKIYDDLSLKKATIKSNRSFYICKK
jgi:SAM-dependent methyltransferase